MTTAKPRRRAEPMFDDAVPLPPPPAGFVPDVSLGDPASVGFRLLCLDRAVDSTPPDTTHEKVIQAAESVRLYLLGRHPVQVLSAMAEAAAAEAPTRH